MNVLIIFAHPNENSFGAAIKEKVLEGLQEAKHQVRIHDLYKEHFNPILSKEELLGTKKAADDPKIEKYQRDILWAEALIIIHPCWWYGTPAIMKGYFDRVLEVGFAHEYINDQPVPKLTGKRGVLIQTFDAEEEMEKEFFGDMTYNAVMNTWKYCGIEQWYRFSMFRVIFSAEEQRKSWLEEAYQIGLTLEVK